MSPFRATAGWMARAACTAALLLAARPAGAQFTPFQGNPHNILEGNWQSCRQNDGTYTERVYDHVVNGIGLFEVHLGPRHEFAIFKGVQDTHREHESLDNLLKPHEVAFEGTQARQRWVVPSLKLILTVSLAGGSRTDCDSWFIVLEPLDRAS